MKLSVLIGLNYAWSGRDWIIIQRDASSEHAPKPELVDPLDAAYAYGEEIVLGFDGDTVYLK